MTSLMTYSVYSVRISNEIPIQSEYMPLITLYFILSIFYTLITFIWHIVKNFLTTNKKWPKFVLAFGQLLQDMVEKVCCCCCKESKVEDVSAIVIEPSEESKENKIDEVKSLIENEIKSKELILVSSWKYIDKMNENEILKNSCSLMKLYNGETDKCFKCNLCSSCQAKEDKDEKKKKDKRKRRR